MTDHAGFERLVASGLDFSLGTRDAAALEGHLASCPSCRAVAAGYQADAARLRAIAFVEPPDRIRAVVLAGGARPGPGWTTPLKLLVAAALLLAALAGTTVAVGTLLKLVAAPTSPVHWTAVPPEPALVQGNGTLRLERVAASGHRFVAIGSGSTGAQVVTSGDGRTWDRLVDATAFASAIVFDVHGDAAGFTIAGSSAGRPTIWTSPDGSAWTATSIGNSSGELRSVATDGRVAVAVGSQTPGGSAGRADLAGAAWHATEGTWEPATIEDATAPGELSDVTWTGREFVAIDGSSVYGSADGTVWRPVSTELPSGATRLVADGGSILAAGLDRGTPAIWTSPDGVTWSAARLPPGATGRVAAIASHGGSLVAVGGGSSRAETWYATDRATWLSGGPIEGADGAQVLDLTWGDDVLVAVGSLGPRAAVWNGRDTSH